MKKVALGFVSFLLCIQIVTAGEEKIEKSFFAKLSKYKVLGTDEIKTSISQVLYFDVQDLKNKHVKTIDLSTYLDTKSNISFDDHSGDITLQSSGQDIFLGKVSQEDMEKLREINLGQMHSKSIDIVSANSLEISLIAVKVKRKLQFNYGCAITGCGTGGERLFTAPKKVTYLAEIRTASGDVVCLNKKYLKNKSQIFIGHCKQ